MALSIAPALPRPLVWLRLRSMMAGGLGLLTLGLAIAGLAFA